MLNVAVYFELVEYWANVWVADGVKLMPENVNRINETITQKKDNKIMHQTI